MSTVNRFYIVLYSSDSNILRHPANLRKYNVQYTELQNYMYTRTDTYRQNMCYLSF